MTKTLTIARSLYDLGCAIIPLQPKSKLPKMKKWTSGPRLTWKEFLNIYKDGDNIGVRTGEASHIGDNYLACIDVDVKNPAYESRAMEKLKELLGEMNLPEVKSGSGGLSRHLYCVTEAPFKMITVDKCADGEICVYSNGRQMVLPGSIHPSGKEYKWALSGIKTIKDLPLINFSNFKTDSENSERTITNDWKPVEVDLVFSDLPEEIVNLILFAEVEDRSSAVFKVTIAMVKHGYKDAEIMSVLTDPEYELGKSAYAHAKTDSRSRAANWIFNYNIKKARKEFDAKLQFNEEVETVSLSDEEAAKQALELQTPPDWRSLIQRNGPKGVNPNAPRSTLKNIILILTNEVAPDVFKRDVFSNRDFYAYNTPWGGVKGQALCDDDATKIRVWLSNRYRFEPSKEHVFDVMAFISEQNSFDPVRDWLESLPAWDGTERLNYWLKKHFKAEGDEEYLAQVFRKWITAMVFRVYHPGCKFDWMPIFEGEQGVGKSSFGKLLVGSKYFVDWLPDLGDKDSALALQGAMAVEFGELANIRKQEVEVAKAFISRTVDKIRPPYGRKIIESPRRCVFFGTTNADTYLRDDSGNRRFKPVKVGQLDFEVLERDRDQLFAEALFLYKNSLETLQSLELEGKAKTFEHIIQSEKMVEDDATYYADLLLEFMSKDSEEKANANIDFTKFRLQELFDNYGPFFGARGDRTAKHFAGKALKKLGAKKWKSHGLSFWKLQNVVGDTSGIVKNGAIPRKNTNEITN